VIAVTHTSDAGMPALVVVELERASTTDLARVLRTAVASGDVEVIVDLGERGDASSDLLMVLHRAGRHLRSLGGRLVVVCSRPELRHLFDVTLLSQGFRVYASRDEAFRSWA
jgi:anti-anti-sigma regulatory factor